MRSGGYSYGGAYGASATGYRPPSPTGYGSRSGSGGGVYGTSPTAGLYSGRSTSPTQHQGSPLKERPSFRTTSPLSMERDYRYTGQTTPPKSPYSDRPGAGLRERPSILQDNPYNLGATSFKSGLGYVPSTSQGVGLSTPTKTAINHPASFNSGVYGTAGTPTSGQRYGSPTGTPRQRVRGTSFREDYNGLSPRSRMRRAPSMLGQPGTMMIPQQAAADYGKYSIILDLDETLIYARDGPLYARPGVDELFDYIGRDTEAIAWTAGLRAYAQAVLANIDKNNAIKHCIYRHSKWFTGQAGYQKDLSLLGRSLDKTLIIENTPDCIRSNRENGVLVQDYEGGELPDSTIPRMTEFIKGLVSSGMSVPEYLSKCPMLSRRRVPTDRGDYIECYWLEVNNPTTSTRYAILLGSLFCHFGEDVRGGLQDPSFKAS